MEWYPLSTLIAALINLTLAVVIYKREQNRKENLLFANFLMTIAVWCFGSFMVNISSSAEQGLLWTRIAHIGAILTPATFVHFIWEFSKPRKKVRNIYVVLLYIVSAYFMLLLFDPDFIYGVISAKNYGFSYEPGSKYALFGIFYASTLLSGFYKLYMYFAAKEGYKRQQSKNFLFSALLTVGAIVLYYVLSKTSIELPPIDNLIVIFFTITFSYTMLTTRLADVKLIIAKVALFLIYLFSLVAIFTGLSTLGLWLFFEQTLEQNRYIPLIAATIPFTVFALAFPPLRNSIIEYIDKVVYGRDYNYRNVIKETSEALVSILDLNELLGFLTDTVNTNIKPKRLYLFLKDGHYFQVKAVSGVQSSSRKIAKEDALVKFLETEKRAMNLWEIENNFPNETKIISTLRRLHVEVIVPLLANDKLTGFIVLDEKKSGKGYSPQDMEVLNAIATNAAIALQNANLYQEAITDGLTGLYHHKYYQFRIKEELARSHRFHFPLSVIMIDIDYFKKINDIHGHQIGDDVLKELAKLIKKNVRLFDVVARYGGEEFSLLLPAMGEENMAKHFQKVTKVAKRLRQEVAKTKFSAKKIDLTISLGVAVFDGRDPDMTTAKLIKEADAQLYKAKEAGRNRVLTKKVTVAGYLYEVS